MSLSQGQLSKIPYLAWGSLLSNCSLAVLRKGHSTHQQCSSCLFTGAAYPPHNVFTSCLPLALSVGSRTTAVAPNFDLTTNNSRLWLRQAGGRTGGHNRQDLRGSWPERHRNMCCILATLGQICLGATQRGSRERRGKREGVEGRKTQACSAS